jgi:apolipoprotein D and lipocalin family protein
MNSIKRQVITDNDGNIIACAIQPGNIHDTKGGSELLLFISCVTAGSLFYADNGYRKTFVNIAESIGCKVVIENMQSIGFTTIRHRWKIERIFAWFKGYRRLTKDFGKTASSSLAFVYLAQITRLLIGIKKSCQQSLNFQKYNKNSKMNLKISRIIALSVFSVSLVAPYTTQAQEFFLSQNTVAFDSNAYLGTWYEVARKPLYFEKNCVTNITATYSLPAGQTNGYTINVLNQCDTADGHNVSIGQAISNVETSDGVVLPKYKVNFLPDWLSFLRPIAGGDYWVLYTDYTNIAVVGGESGKYAWILSRTPTPNSKDFLKAINILHDRQIGTSDMIVCKYCDLP